jgi:branched-chain amino acid transport system permease protein
MKAIKIPHHKDPEIAISYAFFAILSLLPLFGGRWISNAGLYLMLYSIMGYSWNIFSGLTNIVSFGHAVYFGLGAYATFITVRDLGLVFPFSAILSTALASAMCGAIAYIVSYPFLGLRGLSFAICTLAFAEFMAILFTNTQLVERGREVAFIPAQTDLLTNYYMLFVLLFLIWTVFWKSRNSKLGLALIAIGESIERNSRNFVRCRA